MAARRCKKIAIIGAGIIGLSTAICLQDADPSLDITIIAESFSPDLTSDGAGGLWEPVFMLDTPIENQRRWGKITFDYLSKILKTEDAAPLHMSYVSGYTLSDQKMEESPFKDIFVRGMRLSQEELKKFPKYIKDGFFVTSIIFHGTPYLQWVTKIFQQNGGKFVQRKVRSFSEFIGKFDVVVNCSGLGSYELCNDKNLQPARGQVVKMVEKGMYSNYQVSGSCGLSKDKNWCDPGFDVIHALALPCIIISIQDGEFEVMVKAPWLKHFYIMEFHDEANKERPCYIFPRTEEVVVGGTTQYGNWSTEEDIKDTENILNKAAEFEPTIKNAEIIQTWVGLRPVRTSTRLEKEVMKVKTNYGSEATLQVVHNYGHGGGGLSCFWGCAEEARDLVLSSLITSNL